MIILSTGGCRGQAAREDSFNPGDPGSCRGQDLRITCRMTRQSAGLVLYRKRESGLEFLLVHPGGPFWKNKDAGAWTIPKGEIQPGEAPLACAQREFAEELGFLPQGEFLPLTPVKQKGGKLIHAWAVQGDCDPAAVRSNTFALEWPPRSGKLQEFPEIDRASFFTLDAARQKINPSQISLLEELTTLLNDPS